MSFMFSECYKLKEINGLNKFNTNKVTNMEAMFNNCKELKHLDLSNYNTSNVTNMSFMFSECNNLNYLNLLQFSICENECMFNFNNKNRCQFITYNNDLLNLYNYNENKSKKKRKKNKK